jgi:hypothetical protein
MQQRTRAVQLVAVAGLLPALVVGSPVRAASSDPSCDQMRTALAAGRTMDQTSAECGTATEGVTKCAQQSGRRSSSATGLKRRKKPTAAAEKQREPPAPAAREPQAEKRPKRPRPSLPSGSGLRQLP